MGQRQLNRLTARTVTTRTCPGLYCDGGGLYLQITPSGNKSWILRYCSPITKKPRHMGLGPLHSVSLAQARELAATQRRILLAGLDPIEVREAEIRRKAAEAAKAVTFAQCAAAYIESHRAGWRNDKHAEQWINTIETYANRVIGSLPVQDVDTALVLKILEPIWSTKAETASRLRGRIENILDWAKVRGYRSGENPARWKGHLKQLLPALAKKDRVKHYAAMPFTQVGAFLVKLREMEGISERALEFTILTAARTIEAIAARPEEMDFATATWTIPASRMKAKKEHRVPLSPRAVQIAREMLALGQALEPEQAADNRKPAWLFPGTKRGKHISNMTMLGVLERLGADVTVHGFRSSFRDWAAERTNFPREVCEMALAHTIANAAEAAYRRGDLFEKRRRLMEAWADYVSTPEQQGAVIPLRSAA